MSEFAYSTLAIAAVTSNPVADFIASLLDTSFSLISIESFFIKSITPSGAKSKQSNNWSRVPVVNKVLTSASV